jgi:3-methylcrotonyl-CoA carboxylase alpha subunit
MEMNTRLQVEHPVTEFVTGLDLVEWQLRVAAGEPLPLSQEALSITGWAMEARIYAEDAAKGFLPATGTLTHVSFPQAASDLRIETGIRQGDEVTPHYDPMIAKLIVHAPTRQAALSRLAGALQEVHVAGPVTNVDFLGVLCRNREFAAGQVDTGLIARHQDSLTRMAEPDLPALALAALAALGLIEPRDSTDPWTSLGSWRLWGTGHHHVSLLWQGQSVPVDVVPLERDRFHVATGKSAGQVTLAAEAAGLVRITHEGLSRRARVVRAGEAVTVFMAGATHRFMLPDSAQRDDEITAGGDHLVAPMPGLVKVVSVTPGKAVTRGEALIVLEAMKMEYTLAAPRDGIVATVAVAAGERVVEGALLLSLEAVEG